jgi:membrane-associated phospholipid phosphatase
LILATVYLRYHYVVDVLAGAAAAALVILIARPLYRALYAVD